MRCRALILDLDGTVLGPDETISRAVVEAVRRVSGMIPVCIATGRERGDVLKYSNELGLSAPQMSDNGALILEPSTGEALWSAPLGEDLSMRAMRPIIESGWEFIATHPSGTITDTANLDRWNLTRISALDLDESVADGIVERMSGETGLEAVKVWLPYNELWAVDFTRRGVNKGIEPAGAVRAAPGGAVADGRRGRQLQRRADAADVRARNRNGKLSRKRCETRPDTPLARWVKTVLWRP